MIKGFISNIFISLVFIYLIIYTQYDRVLDLQNVIESMFVVGMFMLFIGIIISTNITNVFQAFKYTMKNMYFRKTKEQSLYEYMTGKDNKQEKSTGIPMITVGAIHLAISLYISYVYFV